MLLSDLLQHEIIISAEDIVRRSMSGFKAEDALAGSNPIELPATGKANKGPAVRMTAGTHSTSTSHLTFN